MTEQRHHPLVELVKARLREFSREPGIVFWVFVFPLLMAIGLGVAFRSKEQPTPTVAVVRMDQDETSDALVKTLTRSTQLHGSEMSADEAKARLERTRVDLIATVSGGEVNYRFDPKNDTGPLAKMITDDVVQEAAGRVDPIETSETKVTEKGSRYIDFLIPGLIAMNVMGSSMWGVGYNLVVARKRRLLRRYAVTPMRRTHFLLSYFVSRSLFLFIELTLLVAFGYFMFGTAVKGDVASLIVVSFMGAAAFAGISLLIGSRLENTETANGWMNFVQLPMYVLSGVFFTYERFPSWMHGAIELLPLTALANGLRAIYNEGANLATIAPEALVLCGWGGLGFLMAVRTFRWQ